MPNTSRDLADAIIFTYLNSVHAHDELNEHKSPEAAAAGLVSVLADYMEDTDLGVALQEALRTYNVSPLREDNDALPADQLMVGLNGSRTPHNIATAITELSREHRDLVGAPDTVIVLSAAINQVVKDEEDAVNYIASKSA